MADLTELAELRFLSIWGLLRESVKVLLSHTKLFAALTLTLIVPSYVLGLGRALITKPIANRMRWDQFQLTTGHPSALSGEQIDEDPHQDLIKLLIILAFYLLCLLAFSLLSTSAMVYSVACIYSEKITSYKKVLSVAPQTWKRLIVTFLWVAIIMFSYGSVCLVLISLVAALFTVIIQGSHIATGVVAWVGIGGFFVGVIYLNCVWHLASVVTVLEEGYGILAMRKSLKLMKGKQFVAFFLFFLYFLVTSFIEWSFGRWVVRSTAGKAILGCALILVLSFVDLMSFLVQTVFYFACKAHHHESIDRLQLSEHLGSYLGEYVPLLRGSIPLEASKV